jgi:hypothetical protein
MTALRFKFEPAQIQIRTEEILADLRYPAPAARPQVGRRQAKTRRRARA